MPVNTDLLDKLFGGKPSPAKRVVPIELAAEHINVSLPTLRRWVRQCKAGDRRYHGLPFHQIGKCHPVEFDLDLLDRWWNLKTNLTGGKK